MAKKNKSNLISSTINKLTGFITKTKNKLPDDKQLMTASLHQYAPTERESIIKNITSINDNSGNVALNIDDYANTITNNIAQTTMTNDKIISLAPEIKQSANIMIPSILSPNDMRDNILGISCNIDDPAITDMQKKDIEELISKRLEDQINISKNLPKWLYESMYRSGAKVLAIIPSTELNMSKTMATESIDVENNINDMFNNLAGGTESFSGNSDEELDLISGIEKLIFEASKTTHNTYAKNKSYNGIIQKIYNDISKNLIISDNTDILKLNKLKRMAHSDKLKISLENKYTTNSNDIYYVSEDRDDSKRYDQSIVLELPTESVVPIYTPGNPDNHIGYFVAVDSNGNPLDIESFDQEEANLQKNKSQFDKLGTAFNLTDLQNSLTSNSGNNTLSEIYNKVAEYQINKRLSNAGFVDAKSSSINKLYQYLFSRKLESRKTSLIFIPHELVTYICFEHNKNGTGRSKLEDIKFPLSIYTTLLVSNTMATLNDAINRVNIEVNFPPDIAIGEPLKLLGDIKNTYIQGQSLGISTNPDSVFRSLVDRGISVKATGLPGLGGNDLTINTEHVDRNNIRPDSELMESFLDRTIIGLGVPPSALNALSEDEYSRSIATTNMFFSRRISQDQKILLNYTTSFTRTFIKFDAKLRQDILSVLGEKEDISEADEKALKKLDRKKANKGTISDKDKCSDKNELLYRIIESTNTVLPIPNIAPDKSQFDNLDSFMTSANNVVDTLFSDDLSYGNTDTQELLSLYRSQVINELTRHYIKNAGFGPELDFPEISELALKSDSKDLTLTLSNAKAGLDDLSSKIEKVIEIKDDSESSTDDT